MKKQFKESYVDYFKPCSAHGMMVLRKGEIIKSHYIEWSDYYQVWCRVQAKSFGEKYDALKHGVVVRPFQAIVTLR